VTSLDLAGLVLVAGRALDLDEASVVALADLEAAASVLAAARDAAGGPERQAATLVEQRRGDERFIRLLEENMARHQRLLEALRDQDRGS